MVLLEVAVGDVAGARVAEACGADQVELSAALRTTGGLTPSPGTIEAVVGASGLGVHVLIRPRPGNFVYDADEIAVMAADVAWAARCGASGVVMGALDAAGALDLPTLRRLQDAAGELPTTWHRMVDVCRESPERLMDAAAHVGVARILTSGGASRAVEGRARLARLVRASKGLVAVTAGGGVRADDVPAVLRAGVQGVHLSAARSVPSEPSGPGGGEALHEIVDADVLTGVRRALDAER